MKALLISLVVLCCATPAGAGASERPNIVLVIVESLRRDHVGCYGYGRPTTPTLDKLAKQGVRFEQAVATASWTMPSVMSMFSSLPAHAHGLRGYKDRLQDGVATLASELQAAGYQTVGITANPSTHSSFGFGQGFDFYDDFTILLNAGADPLDAGNNAGTVHTRATSEQVTRLAGTWLTGQRDKGKPFFLHLFYFDPHYDYLPISPYDRMFTDADYRGTMTGGSIELLKGKTVAPADRQRIVDLYDGEIRYTDDQIGRLLAVLHDEGLDATTAVVVLADHGEEFWDHGGVVHGNSLYEELVRIPMIVRVPQFSASRTVIPELVSGYDLMPTILELAGVDVPKQCRGTSFLNLLKNGSDKREPVVMETEIETPLVGIRSAKAKCIQNLATGAREVYDLVGDPLERVNLVGTSREQAFSDLTREIDALAKQVQRQQRVPAPKVAPLDERLLQQLRSLGYAR